MIADGQVEQARQVHRRSPHRQDRSAILQKLLQLRNRLGGGVRANHWLVLRWNIAAAASALTSSAPASTAAASLCRSRRADAGWKDDHVVLGFQVPRFECLRIHDLERELILFE